MRLVLLADTHNHQPDVPDADVLLFAGDMCLRGKTSEVEEFAFWLGQLPHKRKLVVAGNHDFPFERPDEAPFVRALLGSYDITYLEDSGVEIDGLKFWGSPWQPWFYNWAFNLQRGHEIRAKWDLIPDDTDVLITHGPPLSIRDFNGRESVGCADLRDAVIQRIRPRLHVFGHIHEAYGTQLWGNPGPKAEMQFVNASICDAGYNPNNTPWLVELKDA